MTPLLCFRATLTINAPNGLNFADALRAIGRYFVAGAPGDEWIAAHSKAGRSNATRVATSGRGANCGKWACATAVSKKLALRRECDAASQQRQSEAAKKPGNAVV